MICLLVSSSTACISSHLFDVVLVNAAVVTVLLPNGVVPLVESVEEPVPLSPVVVERAEELV